MIESNFLSNLKSDNNPKSVSPKLQAPSSCDWTLSGAITPVKDQGLCASSWAFAATAAVEAHIFIKTNKSVLLSEQNLIDCSEDNSGCQGGWPQTAFNYIKVSDGYVIA
jgi:C1A family cysteine protease